MGKIDLTAAVTEGQVFTQQPMSLQGIRVIDLSFYAAGPITAMLLGDLGAEVLKIEQPVVGDPARWKPSWYTPQPGKPENPIWEDLSRNKMSVTLDLHKKKAQDILHQLVEKSDVFNSNLLPEALKRFGADYATLAKYNPNLIYASGSVFGPKGPDANRPGFATSGAAKSSLMTQHGSFEMTGEPILPNRASGDYLQGLTAAYAILGALVARERLGIGQEVSVSQLSAVVNLFSRYPVAEQLMWGTYQPQVARCDCPHPLCNWYKCKDGKWMALVQRVEDAADWYRVCGVLGKPELESDPRFWNWQAQLEYGGALVEILDAVFQTKTRNEWDEAFRQAGVIWFCAVNEVADIASDPQVVANNYVWEVNHPTYGKIKYPGHPASFSKTPATLRSVAPDFGQHTEVILMNLLGYSWDEVTALKEEKVI